MPALTISTNNPPRSASDSRSTSPVRPPMSPITPPLRPTHPTGSTSSQQPQRQTFTHSSQSNQTAIPPPAPEPIEFDSNPDVIALKSAISVLQVQRRRATEDIQTLSRAMGEAVEEPEAFMRDLVAGKTQGQHLPPTAAGASGNHDDDNSSDSSDDDNDEDEDDDEGKGQSNPQQQQSRAWNSLPKPQHVVRAPPINWAQYAVAGDSLDKLHAEQVSHPSQGTPAVVGEKGFYEFKGGDGRQERYEGVAAPFDPAKDKLDPKPARSKQ